MFGTRPRKLIVWQHELPRKPGSQQVGKRGFPATVRVCADFRLLDGRVLRGTCMLTSANRIPQHLRQRREKIFGPAPSGMLDGNAKARVWAAAGAYNAQNRRQGQHQGPLTWATLRVLRALLWRFHGADGGGRCFPSYEKIAAAARCARSSVAVAIKVLEEAGLLTWVNRIARVRVRVADLFGRARLEWKVIRISNSYEFRDPIERQRSKSDNPTRPQNLFSKSNLRSGARQRAAPVHAAGETSEGLMLRSGWFHGGKIIPGQSS
jgi:hypothetical protein